MTNRHAATVNSHRVVVAPSELGWIAAAFLKDKLTELTFGRSSAIAAIRALGDHDDSEVVEPNTHEKAIVDRLQAYANGAADDFSDLKIDTDNMTAFQRRVLQQCRRIKPGKTLTYGQLAAKAGSPQAARAVGNVMASNRFPLVVPCHRVVASNSLGGYSAPNGLRLKRILLAREGVAT